MVDHQGSGAASRGQQSRGQEPRGQEPRGQESRGQELRGQDKLASQIGEISDSAKNVGEKALSAGKDFKEKAAEIVGSSSDAIKAQASNLVEAAKDVASHATDQLKGTVESQKDAGAEYVNGVADAMRRAAREFEGPVPFAATYIRKAADQVQGVSDSIKNGDVSELVRNAQTFARRQPTAFFGIAALAGFGLVRFLKSSSGETQSTKMSEAQPARTTERANDARYRDDFSK